ncbi:MAG TPA: CARDB domain-containing protein, partial [Vicinamibacterales bacterium]
MRRVLSVAMVVGLAGAAIVVAPRRIVAQRGGRFERETVNGRDVVAREVLVKFRRPPTASDLTQIRTDGDTSDIRAIGRAGIFRLRSRSRSVPALLAALGRRPDVVYAEPNFIVHLTSEPNDPQFPQLWALKNVGQVFEGIAGVPGADIHAVPAWGISLGSTANVVAVIDTGIDYTHPDLVANLWSAPTAYTVNIDGAPITCAAGTHGFNAITRTCDPLDDEDHGSHVSGTIGATGDNGTGVVGINWTTRLMAIRFIDATGNGTTEDAIASVEFAIAVKQRFAPTGEANIRVLSNSWGGYDFSQALLDEVNAANDADMLFVAGAGNDGLDNNVDPFYPASFEAPNVISVAATDNTDDLAWFSNYGSSSVNLGAPGVDILSTIRNGQYAFLSGTSMATPHVSGAAALLLSACTLDTASVKEALLGTADPLPTLNGITTTGGRLNVYSALSSCIAPPPAPTGLTAHGGDTKVTLSWSAALGATRYNVKRSLTPGGPYTSINAAVQGPAYTDTNVTNGTAYYYVVSASNFDGESGDSNEASATPQIPPDVIVSSFTAPSTGAAPSTISVSITTKNQGNGTAKPSTTRIYWSDDPQLDPSDTVLIGQDVPQLLSGAQSTASLSVSIPSAVPGTHYLIVKADADDVLDENNEANNTALRSIRVGPDLIVQSLSAPTSGGTDSTIVVTDTTQNSGGGPAAASVVRFYLSANNVLDSGDTLLNGSRNVGPLDAGASSTGSTTVTIPASIAPGTWYIIAKADADGTVAETAEFNNTFPRIIVLGGDLAVSAMTVPAKGASGGTITVSDTTANQGAGPTAPSTTRFYLSANNVLDAADTPMGARQVPSLAAGASSSGSTQLTLPVVPVGSYYIIAKADDDNGVLESRETNNTLARIIAIGGDLMVSSLTAPATGGGGVSLIISDTTTNQGGGSIGASTTKFYLSADGLLDGSDVLLGGRDVGQLDAGASSSGATTVTIAPSTQPGSYYILAKADADGVVAETSEVNNTVSRVIVIGSDLVVSALTVPAKSGVGATITVSDTTTNSGGGPAAASITRFYLSANTTIDAGDSPLGGAHVVPDLAAGAASTASTMLTLPVVAPGPYYIIARADDDNVVAESKETNNTLARLISIGPDLAVTALTAPNVGGPGLAMTVTDTTTNSGGGSAGPTTTRFYLSTTSVLDPGDVLVGSRPVPGLDAGAVNSGSTVVTIPSSVAAGPYYLIAKADADNTSAETSETNNTNPRAIQIGGDLSVSALTAPTKGAAGSSIVVTDTTTNTGGGDSSASVTAFYWSTSSAGSPGDVLLDGSRTVPPLAAGASSTGSTTVTIPAQTTPGTFYIIARADFGNTIAETSEANNTRSRSISIGPDLTFSSLSLSPASLAPGATLTMTDKVTNQGGDVAPPSTTRFYLSTNTTLDGADVVLGSRLVPQLAAAGSSSGSTLVAIPAATVPGTYYVIAQTDGDGTVAESVENNNVSVI